MIIESFEACLRQQDYQGCGQCPAYSLGPAARHTHRQAATGLQNPDQLPGRALMIRHMLQHLGTNDHIKLPAVKRQGEQITGQQGPAALTLAEGFLEL